MTNTENNSNSTQRETQGSSFGPSAQTRPLHYHTGGPASLQQRLSYPGSLSQRSAITPMAEGSNPTMYYNDASTTPSDKRISGSSGPAFTQSTNAGKTDEGPDLSMLPKGSPSTNSQLPDTQGKSLLLTKLSSQPSDLTTNAEVLSSQNSSSQRTHPSGSQSAKSSQNPHPPVPPFPNMIARPSNIASLLNASPPSTPAVTLTTDPIATQDFFDELLRTTSPCSVEQLEQVYSALMSEIWRTRGTWNRVSVVEGLRGTLRNCLEDMHACQEFGAGSMEGMEGFGIGRPMEDLRTMERGGVTPSVGLDAPSTRPPDVLLPRRR